MSLDVSLFNAKTGKAEGVYSGGKGIGSLTGLTEDVASQAVALMRGTVSTEAPFVYTGKFAKAEEKKEVLSGKEEKAEEEGFIVKRPPPERGKCLGRWTQGTSSLRQWRYSMLTGTGSLRCSCSPKKRNCL